MSEYRRMSERDSITELEKIDITDFLWDLYKAVRKFWWLVIALILFFAAKSYFSVSSSYVPQYVASATVSVSSSGGSSAEDLANLFPYMMSNGVLGEVIAEDMGTESVPGSISVAADGNFLTISATSSDAQTAYDLLLSTMENYPNVAKFVFGNVEFMILDETGVPEDTGREEVIRGSYKRGALKGAVYGLIIVAIYAFSRMTVKSKKKLKKQINLMECGCIPHIKTKKRKKSTFYNSLNLLNERISQNYVESIRKLRTKVMREMEETGFKTLLVTSSIPGEGKTTLAVNLAISIAKQGKNVILIDGDLRNPSVAKAMNATEETHHSVEDVLSKMVHLKDALVPVEIPSGEGTLNILYGNEDGNADTKLMGTKSMALLIQHCRKNADIVIIDTAPSGLLADAPIIAKYIEAALYVVRNDYTKLQQIREGINALAVSGIHLLGYVYNDDRASRGGYGYGYNYGYKRYSSYSRLRTNGHYGVYRKLDDEDLGTIDEAGRIYKD